MKIRMSAPTRPQAAPVIPANRRISVAVGIALALGTFIIPAHADVTSATTVAAQAGIQTQHEQTQIGEVSLVLGRAWLETAGNATKRVAVEVGTPIRESDRLVRSEERRVGKGES